MNVVRVLVVDDCRDNADCLATLLRHLGCEVELAYDGPSALIRLAAFRPHIAMIDVAMPGMTGLRVAEEANADHKAENTLLVAMSGYVDVATRERAAAAGFDHFVAKPYSIDEIRSIIEPFFKIAEPNGLKFDAAAPN
jgi:CheY-like chemotaxis protein